MNKYFTNSIAAKIKKEINLKWVVNRRFKIKEIVKFAKEKAISLIYKNKGNL